LRTKGSDIGKLRTVVTIASITAVATFGVAACRGNKSSTGASGGGEINVLMTSFPDYVDPQLSYTLEGWEVLWNTYTPLLTYKHQKGDAGADAVPGLARTCCRSRRTARPTS
jgi:peptide/nickel transport system substrate-binding protein